MPNHNTQILHVWQQLNDKNSCWLTETKASLSVLDTLRGVWYRI